MDEPRLMMVTLRAVGRLRSLVATPAQREVTPGTTVSELALGNGVEGAMVMLVSVNGEKAAFEKVVAGYNKAKGGSITVSALAVPYDAYADLDFDIPTRKAGDALARFEVRMDEIAESAKLVRQLVEGLPTGPIFTRKPIKNPKGLKVKPAEVYAAASTSSPTARSSRTG